MTKITDPMLRSIERESRLIAQRDHARNILLMTWLALHDAVDIANKTKSENFVDEKRLHRCEAVLMDAEIWMKKMKEYDAGH